MTESNPRREPTETTDTAGALGDNRPHKPADDREEIYFEGTPLIRGDVGKMILCVVIAIGLISLPILAAIYDWSGWATWMTIAAIAIALLVLVIPVIFTRTVHYRISNYRIDLERGILSKRIDTLELWHVDDISFHQSLTDRMLGVGTITVFSNDSTTPKLPLHGIPSPRPVFDALKQRIIAVKRQRGVIKMDVG
jgi:membrane protein YdbS with pleckstrin-like domain